MMACRSQTAGRTRHVNAPLSLAEWQRMPLFLFLYIGTVNVPPLIERGALINGRELTLMVNASIL